MCVFLTGFDLRDSKIKGIGGIRLLRPGKLAEIWRRLYLPSFMPSTSRFRLGLIGLPCSRSGCSERGPSMIGDSAFLKYFFHILSSNGADSPFQMNRTDRKVN